MSHLEKNSLSNKDYKMVIPELFKDIKVYHLHLRTFKTPIKI